MKSLTKIFGLMLVLFVAISGCKNDNQKENKDKDGSSEESNSEGRNNIISVTDTNVITINSYDLYEEFRNDRAVAMKKYRNRILKITDLALYNVLNKKDEFTKILEAYGSNPKNNIMTVINENCKLFGNIVGIAPSAGKFIFELENPEDIKNITTQDWETVSNNNFDCLFDIKAVISSLEFYSGSGPENDLKTGWINFTLSKIVILKKK